MARTGVYVKGLDELTEALKSRLGNDGAWKAELAKAHKQVGERAADWARFSAAGSGTSQQGQSLDRIKGRGFVDKATIGVYNAGENQYALGAFYGGYKRHGWFSDIRYAQATAKQFPKWVGNSWEVGSGAGPYHIDPALRDHMDDVLKFYFDVMDALAKNTFD